MFLFLNLSLRFQWGTPQISICAGEEVLRIALRVLQATHRTSEAMVAFFLGLPQIWNLWEEEEAQPLHLLQSNLIMDCRF